MENESKDTINRELRFCCENGYPATGKDHHDCFYLLKEGVDTENPIDLANAIRLVKDSCGDEKGKWFKIYKPLRDTNDDFLYTEILDEELRGHFKEDWIFFMLYWGKMGLGDCITSNRDHFDDLYYDEEEELEEEEDGDYFNYYFSDDEWEVIHQDLLQKFGYLNAFLKSLNQKLALPVNQ